MKTKRRQNNPDGVSISYNDKLYFTSTNSNSIIKGE